MTLPFVFVELGNSKSTVMEAAIQVHLRCPESDIYIITDQFHKPIVDSKIQFVSASKLPRDGAWTEFLNHSKLNTVWRGGFWVKTAERIFAINSFIQIAGIHNFIHMENDVLYIGNSSHLDSILNSSYQISFPFENYDLGCLSFLYVDSQSSMLKLCEGFNEICKLNPQWSEMRILGELKKRKNDLIQVLPSIPSRDYLDPIETEDIQKSQLLHSGFEKFNFIFDPTAYGFYLGGEDPRNSFFQLEYGRDLYTSPVKTSRLLWSIRGTKLNPEVWVSDSERNVSVQLINLHIHCKDVKTDNEGLYEWLSKRVQMANQRKWPKSKFAIKAFLRAIIAGNQRKLAVYSLAKYLKVLN